MSNIEEQLGERFALMEERVSELREETGSGEPFAPYFQSMAVFLLSLADICKNAISGVQEEELAACEARNAMLYADILPEHYGESYANPAYAAAVLGEEFGGVCALLAAHVRSVTVEAFRGNLTELVIAMELFVEICNRFEEAGRGGGLPDAQEIQQAVYWYFHDYSEIFLERSTRRLIDPEEDFERRIVMEADLSDPCYLYRYGAYIGENERGLSAFLQTLSQKQIQAMADTYTEGYRIGFAVTGKDLSKKKTAQIRYPIGFERVVRAAVRNFENMGLDVTMLATGTSPNKQYDYDHREDRAYYLDKAYVERALEVRRTYFEERKALAAGFAGPAVIEVFGEEPFSPVSKPEAFVYSKKQQQLSVYEMGQAGELSNRYLKGEERSFTIISYPVPAIGERFAEIFAETVRLNTLDYALYRDIQQKLIDVLDTADRVHITGKGDNRTDLYVNIWKLADPAHETAFENCVADVNIPVGEVFTSPVLSGTNGKLFVGQVYLNGLCYRNLEIDFHNGMVVHYTCTNFATEEENRAYIRENILKHHETLPMGEFAIGTNTTAYRMARDYGIADKLPILIAEKTGPHFAVGDTCYSHEEDIVTRNPDGKAIVARENAVSALRREEPAKAYFNCHTDITIPYDELDRITVIQKNGREVELIANGRFVLAGTEELNGPLDA